jgi:hypothetical protein
VTSPFYKRISKNEMLNKTHALIIAKKLGAEIAKKANNHDIAKVFHNGKFIAKFGIRRGSRKDQGHGHIPRELKTSPHICKEMADCRIQRDEWLQILRDNGEEID